VHQNIRIGANNWARRCPDPKESCEESLGGTIVFDHLEESGAKHIQTDGYYDLFRDRKWNGLISTIMAMNPI
jgi:hypothetical protein